MQGSLTLKRVRHSGAPPFQVINQPTQSPEMASNFLQPQHRGVPLLRRTAQRAALAAALAGASNCPPTGTLSSGHPLPLFPSHSLQENWSIKGMSMVRLREVKQKWASLHGSAALQEIV